jgi:hypothetical protein
LLENVYFNGEKGIRGIQLFPDIVELVSLMFADDIALL